MVMLPSDWPVQPSTVEKVKDNSGLIGITAAVPHLGAMETQASANISAQRVAVVPAASVQAK